MWAKTLSDCTDEADMWVWHHLQIWVFSQALFHVAELSVLEEPEMQKDLSQFSSAAWTAILNENITDKLKYLLCVQDITKLQILGVEG